MIDIVVNFNPPSYMVEEGGVVNVGIALSLIQSQPVTVQFNTQPDSADNSE